MRENDDRDVTDLLDGLTPISDMQLHVLHDRLAARAETQGLLDVSYRTVDSPVGTLLLAATTSGLVRVAFEREGIDPVLEMLAARISPRLLAAPQRFDGVARQLDEYFGRRRHRFEVPVDLRLSRGFQRSVLDFLPGIPYGETASYATVAAAVLNPKASRAVGTACATNPLPLIIPCHRVIRSDGITGSYRGGAEAKELLLHLEEVA